MGDLAAAAEVVIECFKGMLMDASSLKEQVHAVQEDGSIAMLWGSIPWIPPMVLPPAWRLSCHSSGTQLLSVVKLMDLKVPAGTESTVSPTASKLL